MKFALHGATSGSNYGDCLLAKLIYEHLTEHFPDDQFVFAEIPVLRMSDFFRTNIGYGKKEKLFNYTKCDALIYFSGGYWGEFKTSWLRAVKRYFRYFLPGSYFALIKKPIAVIGVGGGPICQALLRNRMKAILNHSSVITVRDQETYDYFKSWGVKKEIHITSDMAMVLPSVQKTDAKLIFLHIDESEEFRRFALNVVCPVLNDFLSRHADYKVIVGHDQAVRESVENDVCQRLDLSKIIRYDYSSVEGLNQTLDQAEIVLTPKLHVGIVAVAKGTAVISFPLHAEKVERFYKQLGEQERCIPAAKMTREQLADLMEHSSRHSASCDRLKALAENNFALLDRFVFQTKNQAGRDA